MKQPLLSSSENDSEMMILNDENSTSKNEVLSKHAQFIAAARESVSFDLNRNSTCNYQNIINTSGGVLSPTTSSPGNATILNSTPSAILCRICYTADTSKEPLLQPCDCSGTMGVMHKTCLEKWLAQCNKNTCEICSFEFDIQRLARPFNQWLCRPISTKDNKNLLNDLVCFLILTPLAFISTWYCIAFAFKFNESDNRWESSGLVVLTTFLLIIYILWLIFSCRYHHRVFKDWQQKNQIVILNLEDKTVDSMSLMNQSNIKNSNETNNGKINHVYQHGMNNNNNTNTNNDGILQNRFNLDVKPILDEMNQQQQQQQQTTNDSCALIV